MEVYEIFKWGKNQIPDYTCKRYVALKYCRTQAYRNLIESCQHYSYDSPIMTQVLSD